LTTAVECRAVLGVPTFAKSSSCKTIPLVFMTRGEREARSSKFYPGAQTSPYHSLTGFTDRVLSAIA
jgi:hypothetical protein